MVTGHSLNTLSFLEKNYDIVIASGPEHNSRNRFDHHLLNSFRRAPSITKDFKLLYELLNVIRNSKPDVIIYSTPKVSFFALLLNLIYRIPSVYVHRGAVYQNYQGIKKIIYKVIDRWTVKGSTETFFISKSLHHYVTRELGLTKLPYNRSYDSAQGLPSDYHSLELDEIVRNKSPGKTLKVGYLGRFAKDKGFLDIIDIAKLFKNRNDIEFYLKGMPDPGFNFNVADLSSLNITFLPWDDRVIEYLTGIDILLFPSRREGFGNVCIQAGACGVPTIGINGPGVSDAITEPITGYLAADPKNYITFASDHIDRMRSNAIDWDYKNCRQFILKNFDKDKITNEMGDFIKRAMARK